ncbi:UbiH/UbiF family hydroxylase [Xanthomonas nasturtii]|uniref:UbiH/UbiF family hydroxylase n=1 Tax=Xanthomonas nasturtii TaxID=1843581 RepID=UPI0020132515|nr:UbiH/UbiF family hydroxylase [Xanthomonas nasturtii]MCL1526017.1 UbiH/UbiF family hydroxylase [Xanthomonas nasturtii]MCL1533889.1 UbiH/UbiF family hydroxylase [Xanthomonas nasturtii]MCL1543406.1 UbiH/UbiF family hydroxylase [Xanthomonas nasturtii]MCL1559237.1 UbiH/UbiF family hydroxylase [Xanthomonas nasturtii]
MSRRCTRDAVIVGGGVVGAACALALTDAGLSVALVEGRDPASWRADQPDLRVYAFAADNAALLDSLGVWNAVRTARVQPYRRMRVWDAGGGGELCFDADTLGREQLGWIVEHALLVDRLWAAVHSAGIQVHCPARVAELEQDTGSVRLRLDDGSRLEAAIAIAADGASSTLRDLTGLPVSRHAYAQRGVVAFVETEQPHQATAWQRFLTTGPLAFLPFADGRSSIVWTLPDSDAERVLQLDDATFSRELTQAFAARLGEVRVASARTAFPLQRQLVEQYVSGRVLTLGDAAHVVHPLAGQGVNLGLRDVAALRAEVRAALAKRADWAAAHRLQRWARTRRSENAVAAYAFDAINNVFSNDEMHLTLLRGSVLGLAGRLPPLVDVLWQRASGGA